MGQNKKILRLLLPQWQGLITFNEGNNWVTVPIEKDQLFNGNYSGNKQNLIEHSYCYFQRANSILIFGCHHWK